MINNSQFLNKEDLSVRAKRIGILILPGIVILLQRSRIWGIVPIAFLPVMVIVAALLVIIDIRANRHLEPWHLPAFGALFWEIHFLAQWFFGFHGASNIVELILGAFLLIETILLFRQKLFFPNLSWLPVALLLILFGLEATTIPDQWLTYFLLNLFQWCLEKVPFLIVGLFLAKRLGINSVLLILACEPLWLEMNLAPEGISYELWHSPDSTIQSAWLLFRILPALCFLILLPVVVFSIPNQYKRIWLLAIGSLLFIGVVVLLRVTVLQDPGSHYIFPSGLMWGYFTLELWIPIFLAITLYPSIAQQE